MPWSDCTPVCANMARVAVSRRNQALSFCIQNLGHNDLEIFLIEARLYFIREIRRILAINQEFLIVASFHCSFSKINGPSPTDPIDFVCSIRTSARRIHRSTHLDACFHIHIRTFIGREIREFLQKHENTHLYEIEELRVYVYLNENHQYCS